MNELEKCLEELKEFLKDDRLHNYDSVSFIMTRLKNVKDIARSSKMENLIKTVKPGVYFIKNENDSDIFEDRTAYYKVLSVDTENSGTYVKVDSILVSKTKNTYARRIFSIGLNQFIIEIDLGELLPTEGSRFEKLSEISKIL